MAFLNIPLRAIEATITSITGTDTMPWNNPLLYPIAPGDPNPPPLDKFYRWRLIINITEQTQSSNITRSPGTYNGQDVTVGQWIANLVSGQAWQIISIESKSNTQVVAIVQDVYRYNTFRDPAQVGNGGPSSGVYVIFAVSDTGLPQIDPVPAAGISSQFATNLNSRFQYINLQFDYPLYQLGNTFQVNDVVAVDQVNHQFVLSDATNQIVIGRVTSVSDTIPGWFTINPVQKIVDFLDFLPGNIGDFIYTSTTVPGGITSDPGGSQIYLKLRNNTSSISFSGTPGPTSSGNVFQLNGVDITVGGAGTAADVESAVNLLSLQTGVSASLELLPSSVQTNNTLITPTYGEPALFASSNPATATINGVLVTFNITSTDPGYEDYARPAQMAQSINNANIPNIVASTPSSLILLLTNTIGGSITIVNGTSDSAGVPFAGSASGSGMALSTPASTSSRLKFIAVDARPINFLDVVGTTVDDFGLTSVENGVKACGLYVEEGLRAANSTVVADLTQLNALSPMIGDQAYVIDSDDGQGNNVGEWSVWLFDGTVWVQTSNEDSATTDAKSIEATINFNSNAFTEIGKISTGRRVTLITVEVLTPFDVPTATLNIGYQVNSPVPPAPVPSGLMTSAVIDLSVAGTYTTTTDILFGTDTDSGDVAITATLNGMGSIQGQAQIIVSYV